MKSAAGERSSEGWRANQYGPAAQSTHTRAMPHPLKRNDCHKQASTDTGWVHRFDWRCIQGMYEGARSRPQTHRSVDWWPRWTSKATVYTCNPPLEWEDNGLDCIWAFCKWGGLAHLEMHVTHSGRQPRSTGTPRKHIDGIYFWQGFSNWCTVPVKSLGKYVQTFDWQFVLLLLWH